MKIAIIGGKEHEPEIALIKQFIAKPQITFLGIEPPMDQYLDLNSNHFPINATRYDLILCSQVMEHIWDHKNAFKHFENLLESKGYVYVSCPSSNRSHGSPNFFSAGFTPSFLTNHANNAKLIVQVSDQFGTKRLYNSIHLLNIWLSPRGHKFPILFCFEETKSFWKKILLPIRYLPEILLLHCSSKKLTSKERYATKTFIWATKN